MAEEKRWRFSESRPIHPFRISEKALENVGFRTAYGATFTTDHPWSLVLEPEQITASTFKPALNFAVDKDRLAADTGLKISDLELTVLLRDPALWRAERIAGWPLADVPVEFEIPENILKTISGARGVQFAVQVSPSKDLAAAFRTASRPGQIVAGRAFTVSIPSDGSDFPIELVEPNEFVKRGLPEETVWAIHWLTEADFDQPTEEVLSILVNKEHGEKLLRLSATDAAGALIWADMAVDVYVEVATVVFGSDPPVPQNKDSLLAKLVKRLQNETKLGRDQLVMKAKDPVRGPSFFRAYLQKGFDLSSRINRISLSGRAQ